MEEIKPHIPIITIIVSGINPFDLKGLDWIQNNIQLLILEDTF